MKKSIIKRIAFTLAEVLIVLGIIGIVAQMTIPTLVNGVQKQVSVAKLEKFYSSMYQAIKLSEIDNGPTDSWDYGTILDGASTNAWFNTYLKPYLKTTSVTVQADRVSVKLPDGVTFHAHHNTATTVAFYVFTESTSTKIGQTWGKGLFGFYLSTVLANNQFAPYIDTTTVDPAKLGTRDYWITGADGCSPTGLKYHCAGLIMFDGWQIKDDYPW